GPLHLHAPRAAGDPPPPRRAAGRDVRARRVVTRPRGLPWGCPPRDHRGGARGPVSVRLTLTSCGSAVRAADEPEDAERQDRSRPRLDERPVESAPGLDATHGRPHERDHAELSKLDARAEAEERRHAPPPR